MLLHFVPIRVFHETPQVSFFDAGVNGSNGTDVVIHQKMPYLLLMKTILKISTFIMIKLITI